MVMDKTDVYIDKMDTHANGKQTYEKCLRMADCQYRETPVNGPFGKSLIFCPKIPSSDLILRIIFKDSLEFLFFRNSRKFENTVEVWFFVQ